MKHIIPFKRNNELNLFDNIGYPFGNIDTLFDNFFNELSPSFNFLTEAKSTKAPRLDIAENDKEYLIKADLPGLEEKNIKIHLKDNQLTIKGESSSEKTDEKEKYYLTERQSGVFARTVALPENTVDENKITAKFKNGVLELKLPKLPEKVRKKEKEIKIES